MYESFSENLDFWVKTLYSEANETVTDVWNNARPYTDEFLEDIRYIHSMFANTLHFTNHIF